MKKYIKKEKFFSEGISENSKRFFQETEVIEKDKIQELKEKKPFYNKEKEVIEKEIERDKNTLKKEKQKDFQDINNDKKPDYQNDQENYENILRKNKERIIRKKKRKQKENESEREKTI